MKTVLIIVGAIVLLNVAIAVVFFLLRKKSENNASKGEEKQEPTTMPPVGENLVSEPEIKPSHPIKDLSPIYKVGDKITNGETTGTIMKITKVCYKLDCGVNVPLTEQDQWDIVADDEPIDGFSELIDYFSSAVAMPEGGMTYTYLYGLYHKAENEFNTYRQFPVVFDYYHENGNKNPYSSDQMFAWLFGSVLAELVSEKRQEIVQMAYDYKVKGNSQPTFGWATDCDDPNVMRLLASALYAVNRDADRISQMRAELGGKMLTYKKDVSELFIDISKFMPTAPPPYLSAYTNRPKGQPVNAEETFATDNEINEYICRAFNLDSKDKVFCQATIDAISDKEYKKPHLFGKPRTVTDPKYGVMTFPPVFGVHNIGIEIPDNGVIANLCYNMGRPCSDNRKSLLDQEYGRRRPGQGDVDPSANKNKKQRALVNYSIEEGDGHTTGYYNKGGDYVDNNGTHIGDYETYFQGQLYANSYPSGHSAFIEGVGLTMMMIMPDRADKILRATNEFALSRTICRYHWTSDTIHGRVAGSTFIPVLCATTNMDFDYQLKEAKKEYQAILNGDAPVEEKVNISLSYVCGGYGSCHVDAGETSLNHYCNKEAKKERHPFINVSQKVEFTIDGAGVKTADGKTFGTWSANKDYELVCPAVAEGEEKVAKITMRNEHGVRILNYKLSRNGTHDDGTKGI